MPQINYKGDCHETNVIVTQKFNKMGVNKTNVKYATV